MRKINSYYLILLIFSGITITLYPRATFAETCEKWVAKVVSVEGTVEVQRAGEDQWQEVKLNDTYCTGDKIRVQKRSRADIATVNHPVLRLDQNSTITLGGLKEERTSIIDLLKGAAHFFSRVARNLEVRTPTVNAGVEGTEFFIRVDEDKTFMSIFEGKVLASNEAGSLAITSGQSAVAEAGKAPVSVIVVRPRDAVQWALYYPPIVYEQPEDLKEDDPRFYTYRASSMLHVGRVEEAKGDIERALELDPNNSMAFALQSIIAVTQNEKEKALNLAQKAVEADQNSATARIALSYAQQADFNLDGALNSLKDAVKLEPENALAWARLSELQLSFGELDEALESAKKAVDLRPDLARTQTVLGFAYLTQIKIKESKDTFEKAIELDQASALPRLGLGLAKIREGNLDEGRRDIEIAISLDPDNSLMRSYLGKAYFEEKRDKHSEDQYAMAKDLDPLDPTPFFYDAILKQTTNQPVEALHDLQNAIELNDNRAVYRSKLMLDSDLAARSASLARIYSDLGFQQLALVEGWKSLNTDPGNYSAHRFLSDSYSVLPRHEIARVSELLQSQLLQPINITPIQPHLAESNLFLISSGGSAALSFNEFNPLFNRDRVALQISGIGGSNDTFSEELVVSGITDKVSFSVGQFHYETDGFRENRDQNDDIVNVFLQMELSHKTSIQAEYRTRNTERGETQLRFFEEDIDPDLRQEDENDSIRFGFRHAFSPGSNLIGNFMYQDSEFIWKRETEEAGILYTYESDSDQDAYSGELQFMFRSDYINIVTGLGHFDVDRDESIKDKQIIPAFCVPNPLPPPPLICFPASTLIDISEAERDVDHTNLYLYSYINLLENMTFTIGGSGDLYNSKSEDIKDQEQFNPKFGITWNPVPDTTLRFAVFRTLKRTLITNQTLEPTQVAGFNQFFDDDRESKSWRYGGAIDQKFSKSIYGGAEFTYRDLEIPFSERYGGVYSYEEADWKEKLARAYLFWTPNEKMSLSAEWLWERTERERLTIGAEKVNTHFFPLGINFFHPSGLSASLKGTYIDQEGSFERQFAGGVFEDGDDDFWLVDAAIKYRFPKRYGFITVGATNLFDEEFQYYDTDPDNSRIQPESFFFVRLTMAIP